MGVFVLVENLRHALKSLSKRERLHAVVIKPADVIFYLTIAKHQGADAHNQSTRHRSPEIKL